MTTGEKIRDRRLELHMTMEDLGRAIGVQRSAINKYEKGIVDIKSSTLQAIANALGVPVVTLLADIDNEIGDPKTNIVVKAMEGLSEDQKEQIVAIVLAAVAYMKK